jgi:hypothetical protein
LALVINGVYATGLIAKLADLRGDLVEAARPEAVGVDTL